VLDIPPLGMTALTWGLFMGVSSNLRYQAVFGAERVVDKTIARRVPQVHAYTCSSADDMDMLCDD
jgi:Protein RETICULATA-related